jgi:hypothetical protein
MNIVSIEVENYTYIEDAQFGFLYLTTAFCISCYGLGFQVCINSEWEIPYYYS